MKETVKKSIFVAKTRYDYKKLTFTEPFLIRVELEEEKEDLVFTYDVENKKQMSDIREEDRLTVLAVLMSLSELKQGKEKYHFNMDPANLYYDLNNRVTAKQRDIYAEGCGFDEAGFLEDYKALSGFALQNKYSFADYRQGGIKLLSKSKLQESIREAISVADIQKALTDEYNLVKQERKEKKILLNKGSYRGFQIAAGIFGVLCIAAAIFIGYRLLKADPYNKAVIAADNAYIEQNYVECIDAMKGIQVTDLEKHQKYILANSYIHSENLTKEQKTNVLENISLNETQARLDYWIYLGRGDTDNAIDIALQQSDDQLLLYAYMKKKSLVEDDTALTGEEKSQQLSQLDSKMQPLMEKYNTEEE